MVNQYLLAVVVALWGVTIPGLPIVIAVRKYFRWKTDILTVTPFVSIFINYLLLCVLNFFGIRVDLQIFGLLIGVLTLIAIIIFFRQSFERLTVCRELFFTLCLTSSITVTLWWIAYRDYVFIAPNTDGKHHNFYISRIIQMASGLPSDVLVAAPTTPLGRSEDFYPLAWHTSIAVPSALFGVDSPVSSIVSSLFFLSIVLPVGIWKLTKVLTNDTKLVAPLAAIISQVVPLFPGVAMSWGAMPSVIGICLLPGAVYLVFQRTENTKLEDLICIAVALAALFLVHPPEAFSLLLVLGISFCLREIRSLKFLTFLNLAGLSAVGIVFVFGIDEIIRRKFNELSNLRGATASFDFLISGLFQMNINAGGEQQIFALLFIFAILSQTSHFVGNKFLLLLVPLVLIFFISGSAEEPLLKLRWLATPWYTSYERTLWILSPFVSILVALPVVLFVAVNSQKIFSVVVRTTSGLVVYSLLFLSLTTSSVDVLRKAQWENSPVTGSDLEVLVKASEIQGEDGVIHTERNQGTMYAFMYEGVRVTNGIYGFTGFQREGLITFAKSIRNICENPTEMSTLLKSEKIKGVLLSTRNLSWEAPTWSNYEILNLSGFRIVARGTYFFLLEPSIESCA
jgi:hypothetical protein